MYLNESNFQKLQLLFFRKYDVAHQILKNTELYFLKCSWMKSSLERCTSLFMVVKLSAYITLLMHRLESANQKGP